MQAADTRWRKALPKEKVVAIALYRLATGHDYRTVGNLFAVAISVVHSCVVRVVTALADESVAARHIRMPAGRPEFDAIALDFQNLVKDNGGMPGIVSAVDGTHIKVRYPDSLEGHSDWRNRKGWMSYNVMGVVDARSRFMAVNASWPGSVGDARVYRNSVYGKQHLDHTVYDGLLHSLPDGTKLSYCSLGDSAYPAGPCLLTPCADGGKLTDPQLWYNFVHSVTRQPVERGFGRMKGRWRTLLETAFYAREFVPFVVIACMVLHNIAEDHAEAFDETLMPPTEEEDEEEDGGQGAPAAAPAGALPAANATRDAYVAYLWARAPAEVKAIGVMAWRAKYGRHRRET